MINTAGITSLYTALTSAISTKLDTLYTSDKIDAETYAKILAQSFDEALKLSVSAIQQQEQIDKDLEVKSAQLVSMSKEDILKDKQALQVTQETVNLAAQKLKIEAETAVTTQQKINLTAEALNIPKQGLMIDAQRDNVTKQAAIATEEILVKKQQVLVSVAEVGIAQAKLVNIPKEGIVLDKQAAQIGQQTLNLVAEALNIPKQGSKLDADTGVSTQQKLNLAADKLSTDAKTTLITQQKANAVIEGTVLTATECKLKAEFDVLMVQKLKGASENTLLLQKVATEKAQTTALGVDDNSVIGRQKALYLGQTEGFKRDAEQKAAKILIDTWNVRKTADSTDPALGLPVLNADIASAVAKLKAGIAA